MYPKIQGQVVFIYPKILAILLFLSNTNFALKCAHDIDDTLKDSVTTSKCMHGPFYELKTCFVKFTMLNHFRRLNLAFSQGSYQMTTVSPLVLAFFTPTKMKGNK